MFPVGGSEKQIQVFDAHNSDDTMMANLVRREGDPPAEDKAVNEVFDSLDTTVLIFIWMVTIGNLLIIIICLLMHMCIGYINSITPSGMAKKCVMETETSQPL
jgi:hypothetical protein